MMRAIVQERYGSPDVLELRDVDQPVIRDDQMLVRVRTTVFAWLGSMARVGSSSIGTRREARRPRVSQEPVREVIMTHTSTATAAVGTR